MAAPPLAELLPPLKHRPWVTPQRRLRAAIAARAQLLRRGYRVGAFPGGRELFIGVPGKYEAPSDVQAIVWRHRNALLALCMHPAECKALLLERRWRRGLVTRTRFPRRPAP